MVPFGAGRTWAAGGRTGPQTGLTAGRFLLFGQAGEAVQWGRAITAAFLRGGTGMADLWDTSTVSGAGHCASSASARRRGWV